MDSWWQLGEWSGNHGSTLNLNNITCAFCQEKGNFKPAFHGEKKKPNSDKKLNFDVYQCNNCMSFVHVLWSASEYSFGHTLHGVRILPWPLGKAQASENWPAPVQRFWVQAKDALKGESWDAAAVMARSALQSALREKSAAGKNLRAEIEDLVTKGVLPPLMGQWAHELRELANEAAHPGGNVTEHSPEDVKDVVEFLQFLLTYLYDLPKQIGDYRTRRTAKATP